MVKFKGESDIAKYFPDWGGGPKHVSEERIIQLIDCLVER
ncbi:MAG: hypothetical protein ACI90V_011854 [Bacillariaceae sp.]|jgi:hypothetical protein